MKGEHGAVPDFFSRSSVLHALSRTGTVSPGSRYTESESSRYVTGMSVWSNVWDMTGFFKRFCYPKLFQHTRQRSQWCGPCCVRHGEPITTIRWSWVLSRLDRRVRVFRGCICRGSVTRSPFGAAPQ